MSSQPHYQSYPPTNISQTSTWALTLYLRRCKFKNLANSSTRLLSAAASPNVRGARRIPTAEVPVGTSSLATFAAVSNSSASAAAKPWSAAAEETVAGPIRRWARTLTTAVMTARLASNAEPFCGRGEDTKNRQSQMPEPC